MFNPCSIRGYFSGDERVLFEAKFSNGTNPGVELPETFAPELHEPQEPQEPATESLCRPERNVFMPRRTRYDAAPATARIATINCQSNFGMCDPPVNFNQSKTQFSHGLNTD